MSTQYELVKQNHAAFGLPVDLINLEDPQLSQTLAYVELRIALMEEELQELKDELRAGHLEKALKEGCDLLYVIQGTFVGIKGFPDPDAGAFNAVHSSNMSKLGDDGEPIFNDAGKYMKGPNYMPADMSKFL